MQQAGQGMARLLVKDYLELRSIPAHLRVLGLIGKGNNAGDALIACGQLLADFPRASVDLILSSPKEALRPLALRALEAIEGRVRWQVLPAEADVGAITKQLAELGGREGYHLCLDGLLGMSFAPPLRAPLEPLIAAVNAYAAIDLRAAVDLPSGQGDSGAGSCFRADFTYATGIPKKPLFAGDGLSGRLRYLDLGFYQHAAAESLPRHESVLTDSVLDPLRRLRPAGVDKRSFGHLFIVGGSVQMPGALLMSVQAAVRSGVGRVTAFAPASMTKVLAAQVPEAMWVAWPETANGTLSPRAVRLLLDRAAEASCVVVGPGMERDRNTEMLAQSIVTEMPCPVLLDADALRVRVMEAAQKRKGSFGPVVTTPHMGEFMRMAKLSEANYANSTLLDFCNSYSVMTVLKGAQTRVCDGQRILYNISGGPVLSRGGSGDILSGLIGSLIAQDSSDVLLAVARGVVWHGLAAENLARTRGQVAVRTTELLDSLSSALRT
ncbi:MAG: NAD(P)H-hydrate dehydratase [Puniceicoccaceae bacterium]|nr:MAG: NAD(P)H-hydrate dehydratase [Puniceicoccaceae bacterium]